MAHTLTVRVNGREYAVEFRADKIKVNGVPVERGEVSLDHHCGMMLRHGARVLRAVYETDGDESYALLYGREFRIEVETERERLLKQISGVIEESHTHIELKASMPGLVLRIAAAQGTWVSKGQPLLILEAMKMENEIRSPMDGIVREVKVQQGKPVEKGDLLMVVER
jgi:biotin carboxyl carrier protein